MGSLDLEKSSMRTFALARCRGLTSRDRAEESTVIRAYLAKLVGAAAVLAFAPISGEPELDPLLQGWAANGQLSLPRIHAGTLTFHRVNALETLEIGPFSVRQPSVRAARVPSHQVKLVIVPGVAFGRDRTRLGRGGGYYDRFIQQYPHAFTIGVAYGCAVFPTVPTAAHDAAVSMVVSGKEVVEKYGIRGMIVRDT
jgi:5-formyltetrahydrofolate cyclo-ligase